MIRLIALDVDGTLLDSRWQVPDANRQAIRAVTQLGLEVALVTGRRFEFLRPVVDQIEGPLTLIVSNGALVKTREGGTLMRFLLPATVARSVLAATRAYREAVAAVFDRAGPNQVIYERLESTDPHRIQYFEQNREFLAAVEPLEAALVEDPLQLMYTGTVAAMRELATLLAGLPFAADYTVSLTEYEARDFSLVDITAAGCSKGSTLAAWTARQGIARADVLAIGDNLNDQDMLEFAGTAVVMANAVPALHSRGWPSTSSNDEAGVAEAITRYVLEPVGVTSVDNLNPCCERRAPASHPAGKVRYSRSPAPCIPRHVGSSSD